MALQPQRVIYLPAVKGLLIRIFPILYDQKLDFLRVRIALQIAPPRPFSPSLFLHLVGSSKDVISIRLLLVLNSWVLLLPLREFWRISYILF